MLGVIVVIVPGMLVWAFPARLHDQCNSRPLLAL